MRWIVHCVLLAAWLSACGGEPSVILEATAARHDAVTSPSSASPSLSVADVLRRLRDYEATHPGHTLTIAEWLQTLPEAYRTSFALMHTSRSLQQSDADAPRVILFGDDARTIVTFNGRPDQSGYDTVEMAGIDADERLTFRRLAFPPQDDGRGHVVVSEANPPQCMACHGPVPHFIWGDYATWPGAYGARDDVLDLQQPGAPNDRPLAHEAMRLARVRSSTLPRYAALQFDPHGLGDTAPYRPYVGASGRRGPSEPRLEYLLAIEARPNARLGMLLMRHQLRQRYAAMAGAPEFYRERHALLAALMCGRYATESVRRVAMRLGEDGDFGWHFDMGPMSRRAASDYYDGVTTWGDALRDLLLSYGFADDAAVLARREPTGLAERYRAVALGEDGRRMWRAIQAAGAPFAASAGDPAVFCSYLRQQARRLGGL